MAIGVTDAPLDWLLYSDFAVLIGLLTSYVPFMIFPLWLALNGIDRWLIQASWLLGAALGRGGSAFGCAGVGPNGRNFWSRGLAMEILIEKAVQPETGETGRRTNAPTLAAWASGTAGASLMLTTSASGTAAECAVHITMAL